MGKEDEKFPSGHPPPEADWERQNIVKAIVTEAGLLLKGTSAAMVRLDDTTIVITDQKLLPKTAEFRRARFTVELWERSLQESNFTGTEVVRVRQKLYGIFPNHQVLMMSVVGFRAVRGVPSAVEPAEEDLQGLLEKLKQAREQKSRLR